MQSHCVAYEIDRWTSKTMIQGFCTLAAPICLTWEQNCLCLQYSPCTDFYLCLFCCPALILANKLTPPWNFWLLISQVCYDRPLSSSEICGNGHKRWDIILDRISNDQTIPSHPGLLWCFAITQKTLWFHVYSNHNCLHELNLGLS